MAMFNSYGLQQGFCQPKMFVTPGLIARKSTRVDQRNIFLVLEAKQHDKHSETHTNMTNMRSYPTMM